MLHWGVMHEQLDFVKQLIKFMPNLDPIDTWGKTPLMVAANQRNTVMVKVLLKAGAKVNQADSKGRTTLIYATHDVKLTEDPYCFD